MQDQHNNSLIDPMGECTQCLLNLVVLGRATPYLHNGEMAVEVEETGEVRILIELERVKEWWTFQNSCLYLQILPIDASVMKVLH